MAVEGFFDTSEALRFLQIPGVIVVDMLHCSSPVKVDVSLLGSFGPGRGPQTLIKNNSYDFRDHVGWAAGSRNPSLMVRCSRFYGFADYYCAGLHLHRFPVG